ncbi:MULTISPECIES: hypothetical protein [unclassified Pseudodesulfovibrio]|nr:MULTISPECIES: hypothetical protein [unclassified Pseudodesulfovibrio]
MPDSNRTGPFFQKGESDARCRVGRSIHVRVSQVLGIMAQHIIE